MNHNPENDAYRYDAAGRSLAGLEVIVNLQSEIDSGRMKEATVRGVLECLQNGKAFILHGEESLILFDPNDLTALEKPAELRMQYVDRQQFLNGVKLALLAYPELIIIKVGIAPPAEGKPSKRLKKPPM